MEQIGIEAVLKDEQFQKGLAQMIHAITGLETTTTQSAQKSTSAWDKFSQHFVITAGDIVGAAQTILGAIEDVATKGLRATMEWGEQVDTLTHSFGMSGEQASQYAAFFSHFGVPVAEAGMQLNFFVRGLAETTKTAKDGTKTLTPFGIALDKLGISAYDAKGKLRTIDSLFPQLLDKFSKMPEGIEKSALAMDLFGSRGGSKFADVLTADSKVLADFMQQSKVMGLSMDTDTVDAVEQFGFALNDLKGSAQGTLNTIGMAMLPAISKLVNGITKDVLPALGEWALEMMPVINTTLTDLVDWIIKDGIPALKQLGTWFLTEGIPAFRKLQAVVEPIIKGLADLFTMLSVNAKVNFGVAGVGGVVEGLAGALLEKLGMSEDQIYSFLETIRQTQNVFKRVVDFIKPILASIFKELARFWTEIQPKLVKAWDNISTKTRQAWDAIWKIIKPIVEAIQKWIEDHMEDIQRVWEGVWKEIEGVVKAAWAFISGTVKVALDILGGDMDAAGRDWKDMQQGIWDGIRQVIQGAWEIIKGVVRLALQAMLDLMNAKYNEFKNAAINLMNGIVNGINSMLNNVSTALYNLLQGAINGLTGLAWAAINAGSAIITSIVQGIQLKVFDVINALKAVVQTGIDWLGTLLGNLWQAGRNIVQGIIDGLGQMAGNLATALWNVVRDAVQNLLNLLGMHSPSRVMMAIGSNMAQSLALGFGAPQLDFAMNPLLRGSGVSLLRSSSNSSYSSSSSTINNFTLNIHSTAPVSTLSADFGILRSLA